MTILMILTNPLKSNFSRFNNYHEFKIKVMKNDSVTLELQYHFHWNRVKKFTQEYVPYHMWGLGKDTGMGRMIALRREEGAGVDHELGPRWCFRHINECGTRQVYVSGHIFIYIFLMRFVSLKNGAI